MFQHTPKKPPNKKSMTLKRVNQGGENGGYTKILWLSSIVPGGHAQCCSLLSEAHGCVRLQLGQVHE